jgi:hypothetical protein
MKVAFSKAIESKNIKDLLSIEAEIDSALIDISKIANQRQQPLVTLDEIWAKYEQIISVAATCGKPLTNFSTQDRDGFNALVFRDIY